MKIDAMRTQLAKIERQRQALERQIQSIQDKRLAALPGQVGLSSIDSLIKALIQHASLPLRMKLQGIETNGAGGNGALVGSHTNGKRVRFPEALREQIKTELQTGGKSVAQLSREYGPSHPTIMGWKREWGMTRPRPKKAVTR
jgi:hypothetical protein